MSSTNPRLVVIDQGLRDFTGHFYEYDLAVLGAAAALGVETTLAAHRDFPDRVLGPAPVVKLFAGTSDDARRSDARTLVRRTLAHLPQPVRHGLLRIARTAPGPSARTQPALPFGRALSLLFDSSRCGERDHILIHTLSESELSGLAAALAGRTDLPHLHVVLRYDAQPGFERALAAVHSDPLLARRCRFWTDTGQLAEHYRGLGVAEIGVLPIPHCLPDRPDDLIQRSPKPLTLGYLGGARGDKGFDLLPSLVEALADDYLATDRIRFRIQSNYGLSLEEQQMARATARLARFQRCGVELIGQALDVSSYQRLLFSSDIVLLPYRADVYRRRSSGILIQAAAAGIPTVVPKATWLESEAPVGAHVTFGEAVTLAEATRYAIENHGGLDAAARAATPRVRNKHDAGRLVRLLLDAAERD